MTGRTAIQLEERFDQVDQDINTYANKLREYQPVLEAYSKDLKRVLEDLRLGIYTPSSETNIDKE